MTNGELLDLDAVGQATAVREGRITAAELVGAAQDRIAQRDPYVDAVIHTGPPVPPLPADDGSPGPFHGVPLLVKDLGCDVAGQPSLAGMQMLADRRYRAGQDDASAVRFRRAGFVIIGRTNTSELGLSIATEPRPFPSTRNPWDPRRSPGGSSGGSAAAVAAGMVAAAHGTDMAGSVRVPAAWCGLVGLKPTRGRTPPPARLGLAGRLLTQEHVLTRTVRDTRAILRAVSRAVPAQAPLPSGVPNHAPDGLPCLRVGVTSAIGDGATIQPDVHDALVRVARALAQDAHQVEWAYPEALDDPSLRSLQIALAALHADTELRRIARMLGVPVLEDDVEPPTWWLAHHARDMTPSDRDRIHRDARALARRCLA